MADDFWDVIQFKKTPSGKTFAVKLGSAKKRDDGGFQCYLDAIPMPNAEGCSFTIAPRRQQGSAQRQPPPRNAPRREELDDEIPF